MYEYVNDLPPYKIPRSSVHQLISNHYIGIVNAEFLLSLFIEIILTKAPYRSGVVHSMLIKRIFILV
jgi:hypothetical protein